MGQTQRYGRKILGEFRHENFWMEFLRSRGKFILKVITIEHKNPHYIDLQYKTLQKYLKNEFSFIVYNNAHWNKENYKNINTICKNLKIESVDFDVSSSYYPGPSESHCDALI
jgi:hypothetical protein